MKKAHKYFKPRAPRKRSRRYLYRPPPANHPMLLGAPLALKETDSSKVAAKVDLRNLCLPIRQQGREKSCSGFATAALREMCHAAVQGNTPLPDYLSPSYLYTRARMITGDFPDDSGASVTGEMDALLNYGVCPESFFPYGQDVSTPIPPPADVAAVPFRVLRPSKVDYLDPLAIKSVLNRRQSLAIGFTLFDSFEKPDAAGVVPIPDTEKESLLGGHAVLICGYDDTNSWWIVRNQYGTGWGADGYCFMPYGYEKIWTEAWTAVLQ